MECPVCHYHTAQDTAQGHKAYHERYLFVLERFGYDDLSYIPEDYERESATRSRLRPIIETSADEQEYTQAAIEYIQTFFKYSLFCAIRDGLRRVKDHPTIDNYISMVMVPNWSHHVYVALWKRYGSIPDVIPVPKDAWDMIDGKQERREYYVWSGTKPKIEGLMRCFICHMNYVLPVDKKEHAQRHEQWFRDASLTLKEYQQLLQVEEKRFQQVHVDGYYYAGNGLFRKNIENLYYDYLDDQFRRGDLLNHLQLEYLHHETIGLTLKQKMRVAFLLQWGLLKKIAANDELWETVMRQLGTSEIFHDDTK